jgi:hypothetical protein
MAGNVHIVRRCFSHHLGELAMKTIIAAALAVGLGALTVAADEKADPVGTWKCEYTIGDMKRESTLKITKDGDKYAGTMDWPDQKDAKLTDVKFKDGELTFAAERHLMDQKIPLKYKFKVDGDKLKGKGSSNFSGQDTEFDIDAKREKKDK